jgi:hypothetical protein
LLLVSVARRFSCSPFLSSTPTSTPQQPPPRERGGQVGGGSERKSLPPSLPPTPSPCSSPSHSPTSLYSRNSGAGDRRVGAEEWRGPLARMPSAPWPNERGGAEGCTRMRRRLQCLPQLSAYYQASRRFYSYAHIKTHLVAYADMKTRVGVCRDYQWAYAEGFTRMRMVCGFTRGGLPS